MEKKYEFTGNTREFVYRGRHITVHEIRLLKDLYEPNDPECVMFEKGEVGGFIESEENLSHEGNCWVVAGGEVFGNARVYDDAQIGSGGAVYDSAKVYGKSCVQSGANVNCNAEVFGDNIIEDYACISGTAKIGGKVDISGNNVLIGNDACINSPRDVMTVTFWNDADVSDIDVVTFYTTSDGSVRGASYDDIKYDDPNDPSIVTTERAVERIKTMLEKFVPGKVVGE